MTDISRIVSLLNRDTSNKIVIGSELFNYVDVNKFSQEQIDEYFFECVGIIMGKPKLVEQFVLESTKYDQTKYHKENLITHLYSVGWICCLFAQKFDLDPNYAFKLGFFHDIGKPWAKKFIQTKKKLISNTKGHAQVGENIANHLGLDSKICWCISNHMCSCCHENNSISHWEYVGSLQYLSFSNKLDFDEINKYANSLACLMVADGLGRLGEYPINIPNAITHSEAWVKWFGEQRDKLNPIKRSVKFLGSLHPDNSIIVQMYGHSGFGKSTTVKNLIQILNDNSISWDYAERDKSYYRVYSVETGIDLNFVLDTIDYKTVYGYIQDNDLKQKVQLDWIQQLNNVLDSDSRVKIIDTVQLMYPSAWTSTLESLDPDAYSVWKSSIKFGYYGFPQSLYGYEFEPKTGLHQLIPRPESDGLTWPNINSELDEHQSFNPELIDTAYGSLEFLSNSIINYNLWSSLFVPEKQIHPIKMFDTVEKTKLTVKFVQEYVQNQFPPGIVTANEELNYYSSHLIRFGYKDGMQIYHGPSRDYRGETLLFDSSDLSLHIGRVSLPVFPDHTNLRKDPAAQELIKSCTQFHIVPKFDGSLFVLSLIKANTKEHELITQLLPQVNSNAWVENKFGIWCFGSKGCMFAKDQFGERGVLSRIINSVKASYNTVDNFINQVSLEVESNGFADIYSNISMCFEAIDSNPTDELTVDYKGLSFCPFLCWVVWDGDKKNIILSNSPQLLYINPIANITTVDTWDQVLEFKEQAHTRLLAGSETDEPEGYVVWLADTNIGIKLKHLEYYIAHKPYSNKNIEMAKHIEFSEEYSRLKTRLLKFKPKPPMIDLVGRDLDFVLDLFLDNYKNLHSRKNWACFWKVDKNIEPLNQLLELIESNIIVYYPQFKNSIKEKGFSMAMDYFDKRDDWKKYFYSKYLKI
jgi:putative nucleotidyltransferase with HDIG domain